MQSALSRFQQDSIITATPAQLLVMLYDRLLLDMGRAEKAMRAGNRVEGHKNLTHAQDIIAELMSSLRMDVWDGAQGLMGLVHGLAGALQPGDGSIVERAAQVQLDGFVVGQ